MAAKTKIKIYKLANYSRSNILNAVTSHPTANEMLQGVTEEDIDNNKANSSVTPPIIGTVTLTTLNFLSSNMSLNGWVVAANAPVYRDTENGRLYVTVAGQQYYIQKNISPNVLDPVSEVFEFYVNPQRVSPVYRKNITETRTRGGWEIQHWGEQLTEISIQGKTGGLHRDVSKTEAPGGTTGQVLPKGVSITESTAWKRLNQLKALYDADHNYKNNEAPFKLGFNYYDRFYIGYFTDFSGPNADADNPHNIEYSFTFKVEEEVSLGRIRV